LPFVVDVEPRPGVICVAAVPLATAVPTVKPANGDDGLGGLESFDLPLSLPPVPTPGLALEVELEPVLAVGFPALATASVDGADDDDARLGVGALLPVVAAVANGRHA
jgi:hypothetical protein